MTTLYVDATFSIGSFSLHVALQVAPGITVLCGPSGAGKSTTLQLVAGLLRPTGGEIRLGDEVWAAARTWVAPERRRVGLVLQTPTLFPHLTVVQNVAFGIRQRSQQRERALQALASVGAEPLAARRVDRLSGGEAQRVALARALAMEPRVLLLDEPFSALDQAGRARLGQDLQAAVHASQLPTLFVTHDAAEAAALGDHIVQIENGRITANNTLHKQRLF